MLLCHSTAADQNRVCEPPFPALNPAAHCDARRVCLRAQPHHHRHPGFHPQGSLQWAALARGACPSVCLGCRLFRAKSLQLPASKSLISAACSRPPPLCPPMQARKGEADSTPDDILAMVKAQCAPPHRLILFLQQSSVEWCSSLWMHIVQEVDPHFQRTGEIGRAHV